MTLYMNKKTRDFLSIFHDGVLFGLDALPRAVFNAARSDENTTYIQILGCWAHVDSSLEDGEIEFFHENQRVHYTKLKTFPYDNTEDSTSK